MKALFYRYGSICEPDCITAFTELGIEVTEIKDEITKKDLQPSEVTKLVSDELYKGGYDLVFTINFYPVISAVCNVFQIRYICQTVDGPLHELYTDQVANEWNRIFVFDAEQFRCFQHVNPGHIFHLPLATNPDRWQAVLNEADEESKEKYTSDISFVGSLYSEKNPFVEYEGGDDYLTGLLDAVMKAQLGVYGYHFLDEVITDELVERFKRSVPNFFSLPSTYHMDDKDIMIRHYLDAQITVMERTEIMRRLGRKYSVDLYTASDTTGLPVNNRGTVKTLTEMPIVFNRSKINLNPTTKGIREGIPLRIMDVLGCGGFLITNYQTEIAEYFSSGEDLVIYESMDDLEDKVGYYLAHEDERRKIAETGFKTVCQYHNYRERILNMLEVAFERS